MFCENCGNKISKLKNYCPYCNYQINIKTNNDCYNKDNYNFYDYNIYNRQDSYNTNNNEIKIEEKNNTINEQESILTSKNQTNESTTISNANTNDKPSFWLNTILPLVSPVLAIFVSIIIWKVSPKRAKSLLKWTIILGILSLIFNIISDLFIKPMIMEWYFSQLPNEGGNPGQFIDFLNL